MPADRDAPRAGRSRAASADLRLHLVAPEDYDHGITGPDDIVRIGRADLQADPRPGISGKTGAGVSELLDEIAGRLSERTLGAGVAIRERHRLALRDGIEHINRCRDILPEGTMSLDLAAEELRLAVRALDSLVGRVDVEDILGEIFSSFCIGK